MKEFDFLEAMNGIPEEYVKELTDWQQAGTQLSEDSAEQTAVQSCKAAGKEELFMKKQNNEISVKWLRPATLAVIGTMAACCALVLDFGVKGRRSNEKAMTRSPAAQISEQDLSVSAGFPEERSLPEYAVYNPDRNEYYDGRTLAWDSESKHYQLVNQTDAERIENVKNANPDDYVVWNNDLQMYVLTEKERPIGVDSELFFPLIPYEKKVPEELVSAFAAYQSANDAYWEAEKERNPAWEAMSYHPGDPEAPGKLAETALRYWEECCEIAVTDGTYRGYAQAAVNYVLDTKLWNSKGAFNQYMMQKNYIQAVQEIQARGDALTAEDCANMQEKYGYLIAPALSAAGKLDLLQINPDLPCTDPAKIEKLAYIFTKKGENSIPKVVTTTAATTKETEFTTTATTANTESPLPELTVPDTYPGASMSFSTSVLAADNRWVPCKEEWVENAAQIEKDWRELIEGFGSNEIEDWQKQFDFDGGGFMLRFTDGNKTVTYELFSEGLYIRTTEDETGTHTAHCKDSSGYEEILVWAIQKQFTSHNYQWSQPCQPVHFETE